MAKQKMVFEGTIGKNKYLFDANTGEEIARLKASETRSQAAERLHLELVPRKQAKKDAVRKLINAWGAARKNGKSPNPIVKAKLKAVKLKGDPNAAPKS